MIAGLVDVLKDKAQSIQNGGPEYFPIPEAGGQREGAGCMLARIYHDIGLAAVADALHLLTADFDPDLSLSLERGEFYLFPADPSLGRAGTTA